MILLPPGCAAVAAEEWWTYCFASALDSLPEATLPGGWLWKVDFVVALLPPANDWLDWTVRAKRTGLVEEKPRERDRLQQQ